MFVIKRASPSSKSFKDSFIGIDSGSGYPIETDIFMNAKTFDTLEKAQVYFDTLTSFIDKSYSIYEVFLDFVKIEKASIEAVKLNMALDKLTKEEVDLVFKYAKEREGKL